MLTISRSRPSAAAADPLVSLRKTRFIQPHVLFTGVYLLKRLFVGFWVSRRAAPFGAAPVFSFFASSAPPPWRSAFSRFALVVNLGFPVLASVANRAVKPTRLRQAAYFRSLETYGRFSLQHLFFLATDASMVWDTSYRICVFCIQGCL